ncbi:uncharacterized protein BX663DRAFT_495338 [Cokeromyces recurvatus]|uniref:uncharacterized protein n=1 Tax=Cokeromyces recurvatus TaxID=90255 RepID=UPI00221F8EC1|nr:uncharacterized protein BX663DRAFT_495338 [Cokeromyces recurvatus]KAI7907256.1 hypothetical protein BX663DRAFT_495338 [Cokeromyces recurvatus]
MDHHYHHNNNSRRNIYSNPFSNNNLCEYPKTLQKPNKIMLVDHYNHSSSELHHDRSQEITWLFFRDNKWVPFQSNNHHKIEQVFTLGGIYVDINDINFPHLKSIRVFPTRMYLSYLGMKYRLSCVIQGS